jgi:hypothetical protein
LKFSRVPFRLGKVLLIQRNQRTLLLACSVSFAVARIASISKSASEIDASIELLKPVSIRRDVFADSLNSWSDLVEKRELFTAPLKVTPATPTASATATPRVFTSLKLQGIVGTTNKFRAILAGISGREESVVVAVGDSFPGFSVTKIGRSSMSIRTADSTVHLFLSGTIP